MMMASGEHGRADQTEMDRSQQEKQVGLCWLAMWQAEFRRLTAPVTGRRNYAVNQSQDC